MLLGGTALFSKIIPLSAIDITFGRSLPGFIMLFVFVKLSGESLKLNSTKDYLIGIGLGIIMAVHWVTYFASMQYASVSVGIIALFTFPVITVLLEPFFEKIRICWQDLASAFVVLLGIWFIVPTVSLSNDVTLGVLIGVFSAFLYAIRNLMHRRYFSHYSGSKAMAYQIMVICPCLIFFVSDDLTTMSTNTALLLLLLGTVFTALPHAMVATALKHLRAKTFSLVACMQPFYGVVFAIVLLNETPTWQTLIGGLLVISAAVYETINAHREQKALDRQATDS
ncbi:MAG: drug/metabolite transporter (DMT)-like permease [Alphaproteobacteria bacterium]|jgi:drug/metabolite transporter (DMT)-like permease